MVKYDKDILLLKNKPEELIIKYRPVIESIVFDKLIRTGFFSIDEKEDKIQDVTKALLSNIKNIRKNYNGYSKFSSYFIQIIKNCCLELVRKEYRQDTREVLKDNPDNPCFEKKKIYTKRYHFVRVVENDFPSTSFDTDKDLIIESELDFLDIIFRLYTVQKAKLLICLKVLSCRQVSVEDLRTYPNSYEKDICDRLINFTEQNSKQSNEECFHILTRFFNSCDNKDNTKDAIRKWIAKMLSEIIGQLNRDSDIPVYNNENIMGLMGLYFDRRTFNNS